MSLKPLNGRISLAILPEPWMLLGVLQLVTQAD